MSFPHPPLSNHFPCAKFLRDGDGGIGKTLEVLPTKLPDGVDGNANDGMPRTEDDQRTPSAQFGQNNPAWAPQSFFLTRTRFISFSNPS